MIIIDPSQTIHTFSIIPTIYDLGQPYGIKIKDEQTNEVIFDDLSFETDNDYDVALISIEVEENLFKENYFYTITFYLGSQVVYKGKILATSQSVNNYTINKDKYDTPTIDNNDYIII